MLCLTGFGGRQRLGLAFLARLLHSRPMQRCSSAPHVGLMVLVALSGCDGSRAAPGAGTTEGFDASVAGDDAGSDEDAAVDAAAEGGADAESPMEAAAYDAGLDESDAGPPNNGESGLLSGIARLGVVDGKDPQLYVIDLTSLKLLDTLPLMGTGRLVTSPSGRFGYVLERAANVVQVVQSGLLPEAAARKGLAPEPPKLSALSIMGEGPSAASVQGERVALFFAGEAALQRVREQDEPSVEGARLALGEAHDGLVLQLDQGVLVTRQAGASAKVVLSAYDPALATRLVDQLPCSEPEGGAVAGASAFVGCSEGVLRFSSETAHNVVPYPASSAGARASRLVPHPREAVVAAALADQLCVVREQFACTPAPAGRAVDFVFDASGKHLVVLAQDGTLHLINADTFAESGALDLLAPLSSSVPPDALPSVVRFGLQVIVSDPAAGHLHVVGTAGGLNKQGSLTLEGAFPTQQAVFAYGG